MIDDPTPSERLFSLRQMISAMTWLMLVEYDAAVGDEPTLQPSTFRARRLVAGTFPASGPQEWHDLLIAIARRGAQLVEDFGDLALDQPERDLDDLAVAGIVARELGEGW